MRTTSDAGAEGEVLTTEAGRRLLAEVAEIVTPCPADLVRWRKNAPAPLVAAALRLDEGRRRGAAKFRRAGEMWFERVGVEQATPEAVARHKAGRFGGELVVDLCAGIGGDSLAMAAVARVIAVDADPGMCRRCRWNAEVYEVAGRVLPVLARAERFGIPAGAYVHIDPDRRAQDGPRARSVRDYRPGLAFLETLPGIARGGAIKLGPASDFAGTFGRVDFEIEITSLDGECKEATIWFGALKSCHRRATRLPDGATWTDRDGPAAASIPVVAPQAWIFDPDKALIRAGLVEPFAAVHGLARCAPGVDYLTGPVRLASSFLTAFQVLESLPLDLKALRRLVNVNGLGPLEIKTRGVDIRPETLRARLRPPGPNPATLLLMSGRHGSRAVLALRTV